MVAIEAGGDLRKKSRSGNKSPAICSVTKRSNGMLSLNARMTQSRQTHM